MAALPPVGIARTEGRRETCAVIPQTRYARTADGVHIAYQVHGGARSISSWSSAGRPTLRRCGRNRRWRVLEHVVMLDPEGTEFCVA